VCVAFTHTNIQGRAQARAGAQERARKRARSARVTKGAHSAAVPHLDTSALQDADFFLELKKIFFFSANFFGNCASLKKKQTAELTAKAFRCRMETKWLRFSASVAT